MKRIAFLSIMAFLLAAVAPASAEIGRSRCSNVVHESGPHSCSLLPFGPIYTVRGTAAPGTDGTSRVHIVIKDQQDVTTLAECTGEANGVAASCEAKVMSEIAGITPTAINQSEGRELPLRCTGTGTGSGTFSCEASTA